MNKTLKDKVKGASPKVSSNVPMALVKSSDQMSHDIEQFQQDLNWQLKFNPKDIEQSNIDYQSFDAARAKVQAKRKWWESLIEPVIRPMRQAVDAVYELNRKVDRPYAAMEDYITSQMKQFKRDEMSHTRRLEEEKAAEERRLIQQANDLAKRQEHAATPQMKGMLEKKRQTILQQVGDSEEREAAPAPVQASHSETRMKTVVQLANQRTVLQAVLAGKIPMDVVNIDMVVVRQYFRDHPDRVMEWEGFSIVEEPIIAGIRR